MTRLKGKMRGSDLTVTLECNNNCVFCPKEELSMIACSSDEDIYSTVSKIGRSSKSITLSGGEVSIRKDFFRILNHCRKQGIKNIGIITNGRMFSYPEFVSRVLEKRPSCIAVSVYSTKRHIHEGITNSEGSLEQTLNGIKNILRMSEKPDILSINIVVSKNNLEDLKSTILELSSIGVKRFLLIDVVTNDKKYLYSYERLNHVIKEILNTNEISGTEIILRGFPYCIFKEDVFSAHRRGKDKMITLEPHDVDTLFHLNDSVDKYINDFSSKFSKGMEKCGECKFSKKCLGIQKSRLLEGGIDE
jgi:MoaA/NifB/PqqE/SkfB family radical SAM enzyme